MEDHLVMGHTDDDDLAEIDTTPDEFVRYKTRSEQAKLVEPPQGDTILVGWAHDKVVFQGNKIAKPAETPRFAGNRISAWLTPSPSSTCCRSSGRTARPMP